MGDQCFSTEHPQWNSAGKYESTKIHEIDMMVRIYESTIESEGFKCGTRGAPIMPRDEVSRTANVERTGRHKWVIYPVGVAEFLPTLPFFQCGAPLVPHLNLPYLINRGRGRTGPANKRKTIYICICIMHIMLHALLLITSERSERSSY